MEQPEPCEMGAGLFQRSVEKRACSTSASGCRASCDPSGWQRELVGSGSSLQPLGRGRLVGLMTSAPLLLEPVPPVVATWSVKRA